VTPATLTRHSVLIWALRLAVAAGLVVDAVVHLRLAPEYQFAYPQGIGGGNLFRIEAAFALIAALGVLVWGNRLTYAFASLVAVSALATVVITRYVELPSIGPVPAMYEPLWYFEKTLSAVAEGIAALAGLALTIESTRTNKQTSDQSAQGAAAN